VSLPYLANRARHNFDFGLRTLSRYGVDFTSTDPRLSIWLIPGR
jgi:hypothetical protein